MTTMKERQRMLFSKAIDVFFRHTLCETQLLQDKIKPFPCMRSYQRNAGFYQCCTELRRCLDNILEKETNESNKLDCVYYELAMVDRWNESIIFSQMSDQCRDPRDHCTLHAGKFSGSWQCRLALAQESAYLLANARKATSKNDSTLAADWVAASILSDAAARQGALFQTTNISFADRRSFGGFYAGREEACKTIIQLLEHFPEVVMGEVEPVIVLYEFKKDVAEGIATAHSHTYEQTPRIAALGPSYATICGVAASTELVLRSVYARPYEQLSEQDICRTKITALNSLLDTCGQAIFALDSCDECTPELQFPMSDLIDNVKTAVAEVAAVVSQVGPLDQPAPPTVSDQLVGLTARLAELLIQAQGLKSKAALTQKAACPRRTLAQLYDSKAAAALSVSPQSQYYAQLAQCWERAAALVRSATDGNKDLALAGKYAELAEGVLSSTVTCHEQHMRAMDSHDARLVDIWARLLVQAQKISEWKIDELGEEADTRNDEAQRRRNRIVGAVHLAAQAMRVLYSSSATLLQRLEADLQLCTADCYLLVDAERKEKLLSATQGLHGLVHALQRPAAVAALTGLRPLRDTPSVREGLQKLVCHIYTLTDILAGGLAGNMSAVKAWLSSLHAVTRAVSALKRADADPAEHALASHSADLNVLLLQQCVHGPGPYVALVQHAVTNFEGVVCMDDGSDPLYPTLTPEQRSRLRCFRLYHALRYEQEVLLPLATSGGVFVDFKALNLPSLKVDLIADVVYAEWVSKVIVASNNAGSCERQAELVGTENADDLLNAASHYARAARCLTQKAENAIVGAVDTPGNSSRVTAVTVSARLALMSAKACKKAHNAVLAGNPEACALYRKAVATLPTPSDGAQLFFAPKRNKDRVGVCEKVALYCTHAGDALVRRKRDEAAMWQEAAQICETALSPMLGGEDKLLREEMRADWQSCVQRAEAVAKKATSLLG